MEFRNILNLERIEVLIDPETLEYRLDMNLVNMGHLYCVLQDIIQKIENTEMGDNVTFTESESGRELDKDELRKFLKKS